ncbi:MAG TPA: SDR family NAD(P)-dependent oxidoreductase [Myxococcota bacterium]|nr:SDR family NAD(P)-dependent oxidoreductase [Myxococcota bacterium]
MRELRGWVAAVTGSASGIGRALAHELARQGCELALSDVDTAGLEQTRAALSAAGTKVSAARVDVADRGAVFEWADEVATQHGRVNLIANNAGVAFGATIRNMTLDELDWLMGINFRGVVHGTKAFLPHLTRAGAGHIVNISSLFGLIGFPGQGAYNAAKFAVRGFSECLAMELAIEKSPIGVTCVHPGGIRTAIARNARIGVYEPSDQTREEIAEGFERIARTSAERAAEVIVAGVRRGKRRVLVGPDAHALSLLQRLLPESYQRLVELGAARRKAKI